MADTSTALAWVDGRALLAVDDTTISLSLYDALALALELGNGQHPACVGYPILTDAKVGDHVITEVTRVASGNTIMKIGRVTGDIHDPGLGLSEVCTDTGSVTLTPAERGVLIGQLENRGAK